MKFCHLEKDQKTYRLVLHYLSHFENRGGSCLKIDNLIQWQEIQDHLRNNNLSESDQDAIHQWIHAHSQAFRCYLNTVKIASMFLMTQGITAKDLSWDNYCSIEDRINSMKESCLDSIY